MDHRDHKYKFANEIATETRNNLKSLLSEITYKRVLLNSAMNVIDERQTLIADKKKELVNEIKNMVVQITNTVNARGKQLVHRLSEVCDGKLKVLNEKKDALQSLSNHTDHCIDFVKLALDKGSDSAVLFSKKTLTQHLQKVKCQRADIPNPEIPVRIHVQMNQVVELQRVISKMGAIIVDGKAYPPSVSPNQTVVQPQQPQQQQQQPHQQPIQNLVQPPIPQNMSAQNMNAPNMMQQQQPQQQQQMQPHRSGMPPPARSPQIPGNMNLRTNLYPGATSPLQPGTFPQQQQQQQPPSQQNCAALARSYSQDGTMNNVPGYGKNT